LDGWKPLVLRAKSDDVTVTLREVSGGEQLRVYAVDTGQRKRLAWLQHIKA
jgi:hypothetical protein